MRVHGVQVGEKSTTRVTQNPMLNHRLHDLSQQGASQTVGHWSWRTGSEELQVNDSWREMFGIRQNERISRQKREELLHSDDKQRAIEELNEFMSGKLANYHQEYRMRHTDGEYRWILSKANAMRDDRGEVIGMSGSDIDITPQKEAAHALQKSEKKYRNLFQNSLVAMGTMKSDLTFVLEGNENFWSFTGVSGEERRTFQFASLLLKRQKRELLRLLTKDGVVDNYELQVVSEDGSERWVLINAIIYPEEDVIDFVLKDITQTKENLIELQKVNFELDSFVYHASHDLRSPLRSILGLIDLYRMEDDPEMQEECIDKIQVSVRKLDDLVVELLSISRNDRVNDPFTEINLLHEVNSSIASYYNASDTSNLEITCRILQPVAFCSDATRIRIILNNIISNAIKYRSFRKDVSSIHIEAEVSEDQAILKISDNGEGIEESKVPHIFDMFYRATEKSEGSGLGLYIVKKVADKLDANIQVDSVELEGTTFTVTIPNGKNL